MSLLVLGAWFGNASAQGPREDAHLDSTVFQDEGPKGSLMLIGGADRDQNRLLWDEFVRLAGKPNASVAILPTASNNPKRTALAFETQFRQLGLEPFTVPASRLWGEGDADQVARDPQWIAKIEQADAIFLAGGEQARYRQLLFDPDGKEVPLLTAIRKKYHQGGLVAGTSAGMAVMSHLMFIDAEIILDTLKHGVQLGRETDRGLGLLPPELFVDQHFLERGRFGRTLVAMKTYDIPLGLGVAEDTAIVYHNGRVRVVGYRGMLLLDASSATSHNQESRFHWKGIRLSYLAHDDSFDLASRKVLPGTTRDDASKIDPNQPGFQPYYLKPLHTNDIFANTILLDLMIRLVDSPSGEATGYAFDGRESASRATPGFRFRLYRQADTVSWDASQAVGDSNTVLNVYCDIEPLTVQGPLFKP